jgi:hypothetical protein
MNSHNVRVHNETQGLMAQPKRLWVKPLVEVLALESAEGGNNLNRADAGGSHVTRPRS